MSFFASLLFQIRTDLHARYMGSVLGAYWSFVSPLLQVSIYVLLFSVIFPARLGGTSTPFEYALFCLSGLGAWFSFHEALSSSATSITRNSAIVKNVAYPIEIFPISAIACSFVTIGTTYTAYLILRAFTGELPGVVIFSIPFVMLIHATFAVGVGLYLAVLGTFFRDIVQILPLLLQLSMFATPVLYLRSDVPSRMQFLIDFNPMYYLIDSYRNILFYEHWPNWNALLILGVIGVLLIITSWKLFKNARGYFEAVV